MVEAAVVQVVGEQLEVMYKGRAPVPRSICKSTPGFPLDSIAKAGVDSLPAFLWHTGAA